MLPIFPTVPGPALDCTLPPPAQISQPPRPPPLRSARLPYVAPIPDSANGHAPSPHPRPRQRQQEEHPANNAYLAGTWGFANVPPRPLAGLPVSRPQWPRYPYYPLLLTRDLNSDRTSWPTSPLEPPSNPYDDTFVVYATHETDHTTSGPGIRDPECAV